MDSGLAASRRPGMTLGYFFTVFAGAFGGATGVFFTGFSASASAAVLRSSMNFVTRAALEPTSALRHSRSHGRMHAHLTSLSGRYSCAAISQTHWPDTLI